MNRRNFFFFGATALAAGCGSAIAPRLDYRRIELGEGEPLGLDDAGRVYWRRPDGETVRWSAGTTETLFSASENLRRIRPDGALVTDSRYIGSGGASRVITLPTFAELGLTGSGISPLAIVLGDANARGDFAGSASYLDTTRALLHSQVFVGRRGGPPVLLPDYSDTLTLLDDGHLTVILPDRIIGVRAPRRTQILAPDNTLADHIINRTPGALFQLADDLSFTGTIFSDNALVQGDRSGYRSLPGSHWLAFSRANAAGDMLLSSGFDAVVSSTGEFSAPGWRVLLASGQVRLLTDLIPATNEDAYLLDLNVRREILGRDGQGVGPTFLLTPLA